MEKEVDIKLSLKKEEEIKNSTNNISELISINTSSNIPDLYQLSTPQLESIVSKYTDSNDISELFDFIKSQGGNRHDFRKINDIK